MSFENVEFEFSIGPQVINICRSIAVGVRPRKVEYLFHHTNHHPACLCNLICAILSYTPPLHTSWLYMKCVILSYIGFPAESHFSTERVCQ